MGTLDGKVALVTGGSRGLGKEVARHLLSGGANVIVSSRSDDALVAAVELANPKVVGYRNIDVRNESDVRRIVAFAIRSIGRLDILVCCAGIYGPIGPFEETSTVEWKDALETNLIGTMLCCHAAVPHMRINSYGKIVVLSGGGATKPMPNFAAYAASKAGVVGFAATLAAELAGTGIDVNSVAPGALNTGMLDQALQAGPVATGSQFHQMATLQKQEGGDSIARAADLITFLASPASDGISGRLISARWDDWQAFAHQPDSLSNSDRYTMRRVE